MRIDELLRKIIFKRPVTPRLPWMVLVLLVSMTTVVSAAVELAPTGLEASGDGRTVFLCLPVTAKGNKPEFAIWYHPANRRAGNGGLWKALYATPLVGHPACIATLHPAHSGSRLSSLVTFFRSGTGWEYSSAGMVALPPLPKGFIPVTTCDTESGLLILGKSIPAVAPGSTGTKPSASEPIAAPAAKHSATTRPAAKAPVKAKTKPQPKVATTAGAQWMLLNLKHGDWKKAPLPPHLPRISTPSKLVLVEKSGELWLFANKPGPIETIQVWRADRFTRATASTAGPVPARATKPAIQKAIPSKPVTGVTAPSGRKQELSAPTQTHGVWVWNTRVVRLQIPAPHGVAMELAGRGGIAVLVASKLNPSQTAITGGEIIPHGATASLVAWSKGIALPKMAVADPLTDLTAARDGDCINLLMLSGKGVITSVTLGMTGDVIYSATPVEVAKTQVPQPPSLTQFLVLAMVTLLVFSLWQRRSPAGVTEPAGFQIALLRQRLIAAMIDMLVAAAAVAVIFRLYDYHSWQPIIHAAENVLSQPDLLLSTPPLVMWLVLYELHVMVGEAMTGRSIGKAMVGIRVVDMSGKPASPLAILLRNLIRIPEMITVFLLIFMLVSQERQRLGDLIGRTIVVRRKK